MAILESSSQTRISTLPISRDERASVEIYRPFFLAGILSVLTAGCTLGAVALLGISLKGSYTADVWTPYVLAHANSQLYGWVGFFVIGFALQQHAPSKSKLKLFYRLAYASLILMALGIGLRFAAEPLVKSDPGVWLPVGVFSCVLQLIAVILFMTNTQTTRHRTGRPLDWQGRFVLVSLAWLFVVAAAEPFFFALAHQPDPVKGVMFVAEYFAPYRDAQFLGFVTMMIFGVALTKMNTCFGARPANRDLALTALLVWNMGLIGRMAGWILYFNREMTPGTDRLYFAGGLLLAVAAVMLVVALRIFEPLTERLPAHKFVRAAFVWLLISGGLLLLEPLHLALIGQPFSHAYIGGLRHALTVGFISQMILGVGMHVVARMNDLPESVQKSLWSAFILVNLGNAARVVLEIATDYTPGGFLPMAPSGFVELTGLAIWAWFVAAPMLRKRVAKATFKVSIATG
ncbi:MAG TPA: NnrS family protein [Fimbriimonadaceae bacterium]|nr:NnrS family protein [Fimbriimonadaceae bacterium]